MSLPERLSLEQIKAAQQSVETPIEPIKTPTPPFPTVGGEPEPTGYERLPGPGTSTVIPLAERLKQALATQRTYEGLAPQIETTLPGDIAPPAVGVGRPGQAVTPLPTAPGVTLTPVAEKLKTAVERAQELAAAIPTRVPEGPFPTFGGEEGVPVEEWEHVYPTIRDPMKEQTPAQKQFSKGTAVGIGIAKAPHVREEVKALEGPKGVAETLARGAGWLFGSALRIAALAPIGGAAAKAAGPLSEIVGTKLAPQVVTGAAGLAARATAGSLWESAVSEDRGTPAEIAKRAVGSAAVGGAIGGLLGAVQAYVWPRVVDAWRVRVRHELPRLEAAEVKLRQAGFEKVGANTWVPKDEAETVGQAITAGTKTTYPFSSSTLVTVPKYGQIHVYSLLDLQRGKVWDAAAKQLVNIPRWVYGEAAVQQLYGAPGPLSGIEFITTTRMLPNAEIPTGYWYGPMRPTGPPVTGEPAKQLYEAQLPQAGGKAFVLHAPARTVMGQTMPAVTQWSTDGTTWHTISASEVQPHITKLIAGGGGELLPTAGEFIAPPPDAARIAAEAVARNNYDLDRAVIQLLSPRGTGSNILRLSAEQLAALRPAAQVAVSQIQTLQQAGAEQPFLRLPEALGGLVGQIVAIHPQKPSVVDVKTLNGTVVQVDVESIEEPATVVAAPIDLLTAAQQKAAGRYANQVVVDIADADEREGVRLLAENLYASALLRHQTGGNDAPWIELSLSPEQIVTEPARELTAEEAGAIRNIVARLDVEMLETLVSQLTPGEYEQLRRAVPDLPSWDIAPEVVEKLREETTQARVGAEGFEIAFRGGYTPATMTLTADTVALNVPPAFPRRNDVLVMLRKYGFDTEKATGHWVASLSPETRQIAALLSGQQVPVGDLSESVQQAFSELFSFPVVGEGPGAVADQATEATTKPTVPEEGPPATFTPGQILSTSGKIQLKVLSVKPEGIEVQQTINEDGKPVAPDSPGAVPYTVREDVLRKIAKGVVGSAEVGVTEPEVKPSAGEAARTASTISKQFAGKTMYHGTARDLGAQGIRPDLSGAWHEGAGFYLAESPDIAQDYASVAEWHIGQGDEAVRAESGYIYEIKLADDINVLDLREPWAANRAAWSAILEYFRRTFPEEYGDVAEMREFFAAARDRNMPGHEIRDLIAGDFGSVGDPDRQYWQLTTGEPGKVHTDVQFQTRWNEALKAAGVDATIDPMRGGTSYQLVLRNPAKAKVVGRRQVVFEQPTTPTEGAGVAAETTPEVQPPATEAEVVAPTARAGTVGLFRLSQVRDMTEAEFIEKSFDYFRKQKLADERSQLTKALQEARQQLEQANKEGKPRVAARQQRSIEQLQGRFEANLRGKFVDKESAKGAIQIAAKEAYRRMVAVAEAHKPPEAPVVTAEEPSDAQRQQWHELAEAYADTLYPRSHREWKYRYNRALRELEQEARSAADASKPKSATMETEGVPGEGVPTDRVRLEGKRALEGAPPEDVSRPEEGGATRTRPVRRPGKHKERPGRADRERRTVQPGVGTGARGVATAAERRERADVGERPGEVGIAAGRGGSGRAGGRNYRITDSDKIGSGGEATKYKDNVSAIRLLKKIEAEHRPATPEEQAILVRYVGWGGLSKAFDRYMAVHQRRQEPAWVARYDELRELLTEEEWESAYRSTPNAHYTSVPVIRAMWGAVRRLGITEGRVLEPAAGVGHFLGLMPAELAESMRVKSAVELDQITGRIAKLLYPEADVRVIGFQDANLADNFYDLAISNVPFGDIRVFDKRYEKTPMVQSLHNYFFAKALDKVRPGGLVAFITSRYTMDARDDSVRKWIADRADLIGAVRLPNNAFEGIAKTSVTTDILILQKRRPGVPAKGKAWVSTADYKLETPVPPRYAWGPTTEAVEINEYFAKHPHMMLGKLTLGGTMYGAGEVTLEPDERDLGRALIEAFSKLPMDIVPPRKHRATEEPAAMTRTIPAPSELKDNAFAVSEGKLCQRQGDILVPIKLSAAAEGRVRRLLKIRDALRSLLHVELTNAPEVEVKAARDRLNKVYDLFVSKHGPISLRKNSRDFSDDPDYYLLLSLEDYDPASKMAQKAAIFSKRVTRTEVAVTHVDTASEALTVSLRETGRVDFERMSALTGKSPEALQQGLKGMVFHDPEVDAWQTADEYLSGKVRSKLRTAKAAAEADPESYAHNVKALEAVQPEDLKPEEINAQLGAPWIPTDVVSEFLAHLLHQTADNFPVHFSPGIGLWTVNDRYKAGRTVAGMATWGTQQMNAVQLVERILNSRPVVVYTRTEDDKRVVDPVATAAATDKKLLIEEEFRKWVWADAERRDRLTVKYNETMNNLRLRTFDGSHLTLPGSNPTITLQAHQKNAVWRVLQTPNTLLAHAVGAGKTFEMVAAGMELKRLGLVRKPMYVVPNHLVDDFGRQFLQLYPAARVLFLRKGDLSKGNRQRMVGRIATGDWDGIIIRMQDFGALPMSPKEVAQFFADEQEKLRSEMEELAALGERSARGLQKRIAKALERLETRMTKKVAALGKEKGFVAFEELGVDMLFVDESHNYKNLFFSTQMTRVTGLGSPEGSARAFDLLMKIQFLRRLNGGRGVTFATGTPLANTMAEMFALQRYLAPEQLRELGIETFDAWARTFGKVVPSFELDASGSRFKVKDRFAKFVNASELLTRFHDFADVQLIEDLEAAGYVSRPKLIGEQRKLVVAPASPELKAYMAELRERADVCIMGHDKDGNKIDPSIDNPLKITTDGVKAALDMRLVDPSLPDYPQSKVNRAVENVARIWQETADDRLTQIVFLDLSVPKAQKATKAAEEPEYEGAEPIEDQAEVLTTVYQDMREKLIRKGIPAKEIVFIHDAKTDEQKARLFDAMNAGQVRVLIGSTGKMGVGMNVQRRLYWMHHLDTPWRPCDIEQREGRILRQGNTNPEVGITVYTTAESLDARRWELIELKSASFKDILRRGSGAREIEDISAAELSAAEIKAVTLGDPLLKEQIETETEIRRLDRLYTAYTAQQGRLRQEIATLPEMIEAEQESIRQLREDIGARISTKGDAFRMTVEGKTFTKRAEAGEALAPLVAKARRTHPDKASFGSIGGFHIEAMTVRGREGRETVWGLHRQGWHQLPEPSESPAGIVRQLETRLGQLDAELEHAETRLRRYERRLADAESEAAKPFPYKADLDAKKKRALEIRDALKIDAPIGLVAGEGVVAEGAEVVPGLLVVRGREKAGWEIGHAPSGLFVTSEPFGSKAIAEAAVQAIADLTDWTQQADDIRAAIDFREVRARIKKITQESPEQPEAAEELRAEPTGPEPKNLAQVEMDTVGGLPAEITLPSKDYAMHLFEAARQLDIPARYAKLRKNVLGQFREEDQRIRLRSVKAVATIAHELAHALDFKMSGRKYPPSIRGRFPDVTLPEKVARDELKAVSQIMRPVEGGPGNFSAYRRRHTELMADFYSMYLLDPDLARSTAPLVSQAFETQLNKMPKVKAVIAELLQARAEPPPPWEERARAIIEERIRPVEDIDAMLEQARTNPQQYTDTTLKIIDAVVHFKDRVTGKRPQKPAEPRYLDTVRDILITSSRLETAKVLDAQMRAEQWRKKLSRERLEDLGALVEGIQNLRTGRLAEEIKASLTAEERAVLKEYRFFQESFREELNKLLTHLRGPEYIKYVEDYLFHLYENPKKVKSFISRWAKIPPSAKKRSFPTLQDAVEAGLRPKTQNIADLHQAWAQMNFKAAINQVVIAALKDVVNADGVPILQKPDDAPPDWPRIDHPAIQKVYGRKTKDGSLVLWRGGVCVDPDAYPYIHAVFDTPFTGSVVKFVENTNAALKALQLFFSLFHPWNLTESFMAFLTSARNLVGGLVTVGGEAKTLGVGWRIPGTRIRAAVPFKVGKKLLEVDTFRHDLTMMGLQVDPIPDAQVKRVIRMLDALEEKTRRIHGVNHAVRALRGFKIWFDNALWANYHAGTKAYIYYTLVADALRRVPADASPEELRKVKETVAELVNDGVGGQEWAKKFWATPKVRQLLHIAMLAPDYTISNFNIARKAVDPRYLKDPVARRILWHYWITMLLVMGGILDAINYKTTGKHIWQNERGRRTVANLTPLFNKVRKLFGLEPLERQVYAAPGKQVREVLRYFNDPLTILGSKASPLVRAAIEQATGHQLGSGWPMTWAEENMSFYESIPERLKAVYAQFIPFSFRANQFMFAWPIQQGMGWWQAQRAYEDLIIGELDPSLYRRLIGKRDYDHLKAEIDKAAELNGLDAKDLWRQANSYVRGVYYSRLWEAVDKQDWTAADKAADVLVQLGVSAATVKGSAERRDITGEQYIKGLQSYYDAQRRREGPTLYQRSVR